MESHEIMEIWKKQDSKIPRKDQVVGTTLLMGEAYIWENMVICTKSPA